MTDFYPCHFNFLKIDPRVVGAPISGGTALNGYEDRGEGSGGGFWRLDLSDSGIGGRNHKDELLAYRAAQAGALNGSNPETVHFSDPLIPFAGAAGVVITVVNGQSGGLNATIIDVTPGTGVGAALVAGMRFTLVHSTWGARAYETSAIATVSGGKRLTFIPPIRGGVTVGDAVDFDDIRCRMRRVSDPSNLLGMGLIGTPSLTFQEDMRQPS